MVRLGIIRHNQQSGFALVELLAVSGIVSVLMSVSLTAINPYKQFAAAHRAADQANELAILDAIYEYEADNGGHEPSSVASVTAAPEPIAKGMPGAVNLCTDLVPVYVAFLPVASVGGSFTGGKTPCDPATTAYDTGYTIFRSNAGRFTISNTFEDAARAVSVTR